MFKLRTVQHYAGSADYASSVFATVTKRVYVGSAPMPIRPDLRYLYRTTEYLEARARLVQRSGNRCEQCRKPNGALLETVSGLSSRCRDGWLINPNEALYMFWRGVGPWTDLHGVE